MHGENRTEVEELLRSQRDNTSIENRNLVAVLSRVFPSVIAHHTPDESGVDNDWGYVVYMQLPTGQVSFHVGEDRSWFSHLIIANISPWDGHSSEEKWIRIAKFVDGDYPNDGTKQDV